MWGRWGGGEIRIIVEVIGAMRAMARKGNFKKQLKELADETFFVDDLCELPVNTNQTEINYVDVCVNYNEALDLLIQELFLIELDELAA